MFGTLCKGAACGVMGAAVLAAAGPGRANAQDTYPSRPIEMIVPFPPGGGTDTVARHMQTKMSQLLGQPIIIINKPGAATNIGTMQVVRAKPDGYTLLVGGRNLTTNEALYPKLQYSSLKDLKPITMTTNASVLLVVNPALPVNNLREFVAYVGNRPGVVNYASYGGGSTPHLAAEAFQKKSGIKMTHIPYPGNGPAVLGMLRNDTQALFTTATSVDGYLQKGQLKALAVDSTQRSPAYPDVPTFKEAGVDFNIGSWFGLLAPANTPDSVIAKLNDAARQALNDPAVKKKLASEGWSVVADSPEHFRKFLEQETQVLSAIIKDADINRE